MKLLSVIKNAFAKMNELLNKAWKWVGDFLVDTLTGEIIETSCGLHSPAHKYTFSERVFFATKATIFGSPTVILHEKLGDSLWKSVAKAAIKWTVLSLMWMISLVILNWLLSLAGFAAISATSFIAFLVALNFFDKLISKHTPADYYENYYNGKLYWETIKKAVVPVAA